MAQYKFTFTQQDHDYSFIGSWEDGHLKVSEAEKLKLLREYWNWSLKPSLDQILKEQLEANP